MVQILTFDEVRERLQGIRDVLMAGDAAEEGQAVVDAPASPREVFEDFRAE